MPNPRPTDDLHATGNLKRIDDLESFRKELEGKELDKKVVCSIQDSTAVQEEIKKIVWITIKDKLVWVLLTLLALIFWDVLRELAKLAIQRLS